MLSLRRAQRSATDLVSSRTAPLLEQYAARLCTPILPAIDDMLMTRPAPVAQQRKVEPRGDEADLVLGARDHVAPRVGDQAVTVMGAVAVGVAAALRRREDVRFGLDRTRAQQRLPVILAGLQGEGRWHHD